MTLDISLATVLNGLGDAYDQRLPKTGATYPALVYQLIHEGHEPCVDRSGVTEIETLYQVTIWATTKTSARSIARSIQSTYSGHVGQVGSPQTAVTNIQVDIVAEGEDVEEGLKSVTVEIRIFQ